MVGSMKDDAVVSIPSSAKKKPEVLSAGVNVCCCGVANMLLKSMFVVSKAKPAPWWSMTMLFVRGRCRWIRRLAFVVVDG